jgi:hypothetical protein
VKHILFIVIAILIVLAIWFFLGGAFWKIGSILPNASSTAPAATSTDAGVTINNDTGGSHAGLSYGAAVNTFKNRRIQFDQSCVATPSYIVLKNGTNVMFDNRSPVGRYIALDRVRYYLRGYDFRVLTLTYPRLPHTTLVDCGSGRNNAQIVLN